MSVLFRTLRSGSSGNTALLAAGGCALFLDLGAPANTAVRQSLAELRQRRIKPLAALITHEHGDHFSPGPLRAMNGHSIPVYAPARAIAHAHQQTNLGFWSGRPELRCYDHAELFEPNFTVGPFHVQPIQVSHNPGGSCYAFLITIDAPGRLIRAVYATDLCEPRSLPAALVDSDLLFLESNHDPELLRLRPNPSSRFHLRNSQAAELLLTARKASSRPPQLVCLGHLSERRNTPDLAESTLRDTFTQAAVDLDFPVLCAPRHQPSLWHTITSP
jgi:ribonuclease BN (tRNA processing enzyme)